MIRKDEKMDDKGKELALSLSEEMYQNIEHHAKKRNMDIKDYAKFMLSLEFYSDYIKSKDIHRLEESLSMYDVKDILAELSKNIQTDIGNLQDMIKQFNRMIEYLNKVIEKKPK